MREDADRLDEIRTFRTDAAQEWDPILDEAATDMRFVAGDPWDPKDKRAREDAGRPCLTIDELNQYFNQAINDLRANPLGVTFSPTGNGANDRGAAFYQNKAREIEYRSSAQVAYITAAENMIQQSVGWVRVTTKYASPRSWDQELWIEPIMNPAQVLPGHHVWPDGRDLTQLLYIETLREQEFKRRFPGAAIVNFSAADRAQAPSWVADGTVDVGEYWAKTPYTRRLLMLTPKGQPHGEVQSVFADELTPKGEKRPIIPPSWIVRREEDREDFKVSQCVTNGLEILSDTPWKGQDIPFVSFYGKVLYVEGVRTILSMTRLARDPYLAYCFYRTSIMEIVGMVTKNPYWAYEGQLDQTQVDEIAKSIHEPVAVLFAKATAAGLPPGTVLPLPTRNQFTADIAAYSQAAEEMRRAVQAAMGIMPLPTSAQRQNDKSGEALKRIADSSQKGSFHFTDHYQGGIQRVGMLLENLIDKVHDTARTIWVHEADQTPQQVRINDPRDPESISTKGYYLVTVSAGPSFESERAAADDFVGVVVQSLPMIAQLRGPQVASAILALSVKLKQLGPIGEQIADLIEPPEMKTADGKPPDPKLVAAQSQVQQLQQQLQEAGFAIKTKQVEGQIKFSIEQMKVQATSADKAADREVKLAIAELGARVDRLALFLEESRLVGARAHEARQASADRTHEATVAAHGHAANLVEGAKDRAHAHVQGVLDHHRALELQAAAVDATPETADTVGG